MTKLRRCRIPALLLSVCLLVANPASGENLSASDAAKLYPGETTYSIFRKGKNVGKHSLTVSSLSNRIEVGVESNITIRVLKIPVFKFSYQSSELWEDGRLLSVNSVTKTDKKVEKASLQNNGAQSLLTYNDKQTTSDLIQYATNHWNISAVEQSQLFNTIKGVKSDVSVEFVGNESLNVNGTILETKHYAYSGDITAESWYDENNRWVKLAFLGSDGNQIVYLIDNP